MSAAIHGLSTTLAPNASGGRVEAWLDDVRVHGGISTSGWDVTSLMLQSKDASQGLKSNLEFRRWDNAGDGIWVRDGLERGELPARRLEPAELKALLPRILEAARATGTPDLGRAAAQTQAELAALGLAKLDGPPPSTRDWATLLPIHTENLEKGKLSVGGGFDAFRLQAMLGSDPVELTIPVSASAGTTGTLKRWNPAPGSAELPSVALTREETISAAEAVLAFDKAPRSSAERFGSLAFFALDHLKGDAFAPAAPQSRPPVALAGAPAAAPFVPAKDPITGQ